MRRYWLLSSSGVQNMHLNPELESRQLRRTYSIYISKVPPLGASVDPL